MGTTRSGPQGIDSERPYGWYGRSRCRQGKGGETAGRCVQPHVRLRRAKPTGEGQWQGQGHRLCHGHELRADGRTAHQDPAHRFGFGYGQHALTYEYGDSHGLTIIGVEDAYQQTFTKYSKTPIVKSTRVTGAVSSYSRQTTKNIKSRSGSKTAVKVSAILGVEIGID